MNDSAIEVYIIDGLAEGVMVFACDQVPAMMAAIETSLEYFDSGIPEVTLTIKKDRMSEEKFYSLPEDY